MALSPRKPKVFFFDSSLWSLFHFRGAIIRAMLGAGWEVVILCPKEDINQSLWISGCRFIQLDVVRTTKSAFVLLRAMKFFYGCVKRERPDVVFAYTLKPILVSGVINAFAKFHSVMVFAGLGQLLNQSGISYILLKAATRVAIFGAHKVILSNKDDLSYFSPPIFFSHSRFNILPHGEGLDTNYFSPSPSQDANTREISFLMIGRLLKEKGVLEFIESARIIKREFPNATFVLCGYFDDNHPNAISRDIINNSCREGLLDFIGVVEDTRLYLNRARCFVMPSYYNEGMNRSIMDALSMGVPVITTDNRGCRDLVQDGSTGFIVPPRNISELCEAMRSVLVMNETAWSIMSKQAINYARDYLDDKHVVATYREVVREVMPTSW